MSSAGEQLCFGVGLELLDALIDVYPARRHVLSRRDRHLVRHAREVDARRGVAGVKDLLLEPRVVRRLAIELRDRPFHHSG